MKTLETKVDGIATELKDLTKIIGRVAEGMDKGFEKSEAGIAFLCASVGTLAQKMDKGFKQTSLDIDDLAAMTIREFGELRQEKGLKSTLNAHAS